MMKLSTIVCLAAVCAAAGCGEKPQEAVAAAGGADVSDWSPACGENLSMWAASFKAGKGDAGGWAPLMDRQTWRVIYVYVHNLNRRQDLGELAAFSPHFASQEELETFALVYLQRKECWRMEGGNFDPDPRGRYEYAEPGTWEKWTAEMKGEL